MDGAGWIFLLNSNTYFSFRSNPEFLQVHSHLVTNLDMHNHHMMPVYNMELNAQEFNPWILWFQ